MTIRRLLVANRGEIARRIFRTAQEMGIFTVAVYSEGDSGAPFVSDADLGVALGGTTAAESYLDAGKILQAAVSAGVDAIHPGYGFLSENAAFADAVIAAGMTWIGPPSAAIAAMGDKLAAKRTMAGAALPTLPSVEITDSVDLSTAGNEIGFPLLVKASAGGGGKGMRVVNSEPELADAIAGAKREALSAFGDDTVFLEHFLATPRHVEIQVLGDQHGTVLHCFERECSIQRRHQKVIEEAPSPVLSESLRGRMGAAAVAAVEAIGYVSAGTVEFLLDGSGDDAQFFFLEVNTRLQVEHPVTEKITGLDLVREQIRIANGEELGYNQADLSINGHSIEARLYAEDPANNFLPATGRVDIWHPAPGPIVRYDSGIEAGSEVTVEFDPMLAKVISHAPTRTEAALKLALALERTRLHGVTTNRDFLVAALRNDEFLAANTTTDFIDRVSIPGQRVPTECELEDASIAIVLMAQKSNRSKAIALRFMPSGFRNSSMPSQQMVLIHGETEIVVNYRRLRNGSFEIRIGEETESRSAKLLSSTSDHFEIQLDGVHASGYASKFGSRWYVDIPAGGLSLLEKSRFPGADIADIEGGLTAPMPGKILAIEVAKDDSVTAGQLLVLMEAMKMEHQIVATFDGTVADVRVAVGDQVDNGELLVIIATEGA
ncbi:MAG: acetyl/propionyl-CoA carboxylase subunit alpha [Acidimicrobiaceae bacterium]|nr:acetyl/propionyl-CoA carboxylase subunit alpha [Acidimicrobiaceae bacterium]MCS5675194.1 ATP-grasp domain-containing protein [Acidimicrobiales bacterium]MEE2806506.1 biotin carboxylase N-terminal domain-containing protein [Actinomycetota bacterium]|tara:strand:- start:2889 stop:4874 length:1986 start_codon:yes stop_codon:yes gene_type:complete